MSKTYGVFYWVPSGRYYPCDAISVYKRRDAAYRYAEHLYNETGRMTAVRVIEEI